MGPPGKIFYPSLAGSLDLRSLREYLENHQLSCPLPSSPQITKSLPKDTKRSPNCSLKPFLETPNYWINQKSEITQNTWFFTVVMAHAAIAFEHNFNPSATKIMDLETVCLSVIPDHRKSRKCAQSRSREAPRIREKIDKNGHLGFSVSIGCPSAAQDHQNGVPGPTKELRGVQNSRFR